MKKHYKFHTLIAIFTLPLAANAQSFQQKLYPPEPNRAADFSYAPYTNPGTQLDEQTLVVTDGNAYSQQLGNCEKGYGTVSIYKKKTNAWELSQKLTSNVTTPVRFGKAIALHNNRLAVLSENETNGDAVKRGAIYVYTREHIDSVFVLRQKLWGPEPFLNTILSFQSVTVNDEFVAASVGNSNEIKVFRIEADTILPHHTYKGTNYSPDILDITENNTLVGISQNSHLGFYKIEEDTIIKTSSQNQGGNFAFESLKADGNSVVVVTSSNRQDFSVTFTLYQVGFDGIPILDNAFFSYQQQMRLVGLDLKENRWLVTSTYQVPPFANNSSLNTLHVYEFANDNYSLSGQIKSPAGATNAFGASLSVTDSLLVVGDYKDSTNQSVNDEICPQKKGKGAVSIYNLKTDILTALTKKEGNASVQQTLISPNPLTGNIISVALPGAEKIEVLNAAGNSLLTQQVTHSQCRLEGLPQGLYLIKISAGSVVKTERLIVE